MTSDALIRELATELQDVLRDLDEAHLRENPEEEFEALAARLVLKLSRKKLTIASAVDIESAYAAMRILDTFSKWLDRHPERHLVTGVDRSGTFEIIVRTAGQTSGYFRGENVQDAYAQAAQTISFNEGEHDEEEQTQKHA